MQQTTHRIFGLDLMRTMAIVIVVLKHSNILVGAKFTIPIHGVDLFFVLSGYLIGNNFLQKTLYKQDFHIVDILNFLKQRWLRTLPNYFLFLIINILLIYFGLIKGTLNKYLITYFVFFQNFYKPFDFLFWESWSLAVEEWFYLFFPVFILFFYKIIKNNRSIRLAYAITTILFLIIPLIYRLNINPDLDYDLFTRKVVLARFDTIGFGLLAAYIHNIYPHFWNRFRNFQLFSGILLLIFLKSYYLTQNHTYTCLRLSFIGLGITMLLPALESLKNETIPLKPIRFISKISYSIYLTHIPISYILSGIFETKNFLIYILYWFITLLLSTIIYRWFESPFMRLRKKIRFDYKNNKISLVKVF
ncbi:MAG: acyltransferase family protein [Salinivirgaceae bacterium]